MHANVIIYNSRERYNIPEPESILACLRAACSSILSLGRPAATALAIPPMSSIYTDNSQVLNLGYTEEINLPLCKQSLYHT